MTEIDTTDRMDNLEYCLHRMMHFTGNDIALPATLRERQQLLRALMNVWEPQPLDADFLAAQDRELQWQLADKGIVVPPEAEAIVLWQGDITRLKVDAIVNAANSGMLGCWAPLHGCIDNAIHSAAGLQLRAECHEQVKAGLWRGASSAADSEAIITRGYNLPAHYVIHTVGPIVAPLPKATAEHEQQLEACYRTCLTLAAAKGCHSIALCCLSTGEFGFPNRRAAEIAVSTVHSTLPTLGTSMQVIFNVFKPIDYDIYNTLLRTP